MRYWLSVSSGQGRRGLLTYGGGRLVETNQAVRRARRLIRRYGMQPPRGLLAVPRRRAWARLARASQGWSRGDRENAAKPLLADWADAGMPDESPLAGLLATWAGGPDALHRLIIRAARSGMRDAYREYCIRNGLAPADPAERALFYAETRQREQRQAIDPDGALLTAAYHAGQPGESPRAWLRAFLEREAAETEGTGPDAVRVVTRGGALRATQLPREELDYLVRWLKARQDWAGLWDLIRDLPPLDIPAALRGVPAQWQPAAARDQALLHVLARAGPEEVRPALDALVGFGVVHLEVPGVVHAGALSDDGQRLAVWTHDAPRDKSAGWAGGQSRPGTISVYRLPDGALLAQHGVTMFHSARLAYAGRELAAFTALPGHDAPESWLYRIPEDGRPPELARHDAGSRTERAVAVDMAAYGEGFVTVAADHTLTFYDNECRPLTTSGYQPPRGRAAGPNYLSGASGQLAVDQASGRIAVMRDYYGVLLDARHRDGSVIPTVGEIEQHLGWHRASLQGADVILTSHGSGIMRWHLGGGRRRLTYMDAGFRRDYEDIDLPGAWDMAWIPASGELVCRAGATGDGGNIYYLDPAYRPGLNVRDLAVLISNLPDLNPEALRDLDPQLVTDAMRARSYQQFPGRRALTGTRKWATALFSSPGGTCYAIGSDGFADVVLPEHLAVQPLKDLAAKPLGSWQAADSATAAATAWLAGRDPQFRPLANLLSACRDYHLGAGGKHWKARTAPAVEASRRDRPPRPGRSSTM